MTRPFPTSIVVGILVSLVMAVMVWPWGVWFCWIPALLGFLHHFSQHPTPKMQADDQLAAQRQAAYAAFITTPAGQSYLLQQQLAAIRQQTAIQAAFAYQQAQHNHAMANDLDYLRQTELWHNGGEANVVQPIWFGPNHHDG